ncbi:hypothetical protein [Streptomyces sp. NPDC058664]|uniref:hypothetical protein n=1 Tax=unclassified Streptomyces TaxID=2593676 RepID=UPI003647DCE2
MSMTVAGAGLAARTYRDSDGPGLVELLNEHRLPGTPDITGAHLQDALAGRLPLGPFPDFTLSEGAAAVLSSGDGQLQGAVSWALCPENGHGVLLWLVCRDDDQSLAAHLINHVLSQLGRRTLETFTQPTGLAPAGLPVRLRRGTHRALEMAGFTATEQWIHCHHRLTGPRPEHLALTDLSPTIEPPGWHLKLRTPDGTGIGEAFLTTTPPAHATLEWITLELRQQCLGHILLEACLSHLAGHGIHHVTASLPLSDQPEHHFS